MNPPQPLAHLLRDDGIYPNNSRLPLLVYPGALALPDRDAAGYCERLIQANHWGGSWRNGVYAFHHYHSTAHEVLLVYAGQATVQLGGEEGLTLSIQRGDVLVIPAGVAHKKLSGSRDFAVVGAYPIGQRPDMNEGRAGERPAADERIAAVALPLADPLFGAGGPLVSLWQVSPDYSEEAVH